METPDKGIWSKRLIGRDQALVRTVGSAEMAFGLGPAQGPAKEPARLNAMIEKRITSLRFCRQVHGRIIHRISAGAEEVLEIGPGDGLITDCPGVGLLVWTADCVPILLAADGVVAAVHSGWRGSAVDVVGAAILRMTQDIGITRESIHAALGPAVCGRCYQVGPEVPEALRAFDLDESRWLEGDHVNLRGFLAARLEAFGLPVENIETVGGCTVEEPDLASYRRDGENAGRQWSLVYLNALPSPGAGP